jgi:hypothetical protein
MPVSIPNPCHENWDQMSPTQNGKHCQSCAKNVIDFTSFTQEEIEQFLKNHPQACGRFYKHQISRNTPTSPVSQSQLKYACSLLLVALSSNQLYSQDTLYSPVANTNISINTTHLQDINILNILVNKPASNTSPIQKIKISVAEFTLDTNLIYNESLQIHLPKQVTWDSLRIEFTDSLSVSTLFTIPKSQLSYHYFFHPGTIIFSFDEKWTYSVLFPITTKFDIPMMMGIPQIEYPRFDYPQFEIKLDTTFETFILGNYALIDTLTEDSIKTLVKNKPIVTKPQSSQPWYTALWIFLSTIVAGFIYRYRKFKKSILG